MPKLRAAPKESPKDENPKPAAAENEQEPIVNEEVENGEEEGKEGEVQGQGQEAEDPSVVLQRQIEELKKSEKLQRTLAEQAYRDREEAIKRARERETEVTKFRGEANQSRFDAISSGIAAAQAEASSAQRDIENAATIGDTKAQAEAYRKLARAEANLARLEDGKIALEEEQKREKERPQQPDDPLERSGLPDNAKSWLRSHPEYLTDQRKNAKIQALHWDIVDEGHTPYSTAYFESMEQHLGMREKPVKAAPQERREEEDTTMVSAPVSREVPSSNDGRRSVIRLTVAQREAAKMAGITEAEYAKQLTKLNDEKASGNYGDRR